jgi:hypothetical protein
MEQRRPVDTQNGVLNAQNGAVQVQGLKNPWSQIPILDEEQDPDPHQGDTDPKNRTTAKFAQITQTFK